jgi:hypothetical protein
MEMAWPPVITEAACTSSTSCWTILTKRLGWPALPSLVGRRKPLVSGDHRAQQQDAALRAPIRRMSAWGLGCAKTLYRGSPADLAADYRHQRLDADDVQSTHKIIGQYTRAISVETFGSAFVRKCVVPIRIFIVPNGCSTVSRHTRMSPDFCRAFAARLRQPPRAPTA